MEAYGREGKMSHLPEDVRKQEPIDCLEVVDAIKKALSRTGFQCGECVKFTACNKVAQEEFCLEWEFFTYLDRPSGSQKSGP